MTERNTTESLKEFLGTFKRRMPKDVFIDMEAALSDIFPKLKESGDERIRKALLDLFKIENFNGYVTLNGIDVDDVIAWLEKQGRKISISEDLYEHIRNAKACLDDMSNINDDYYNQAKFDLEDALKIIKTMEKQ